MSTQLKAQIDQLLTNVASKYEPKSYLSEQILPMVPSAQYTGKLGGYGTSHLRIVTSVKGGKGKYRQVDSTVYNNQGFSIEGHGLTDIVTPEDYRNVILPFKAEEDKTLALQTLLYLEKEKGLADTLASTAVLTQNVTLSGTDQYNDKLNSDPVSDFEDARAAVYNGCGEVPNLAVLSWDVWNKLRFHPQILDSLGFKYDRPGGLKEAELASAMGVESILIGTAKYESAKEGQTSSLASVWGKHIVFMVCPAKAQVGQVALGYTVRLDGQAPRKVYKQDLFNPPGAKEILVEDSYDQLISNANAAYLIKNAIA